MLLNIAVFPLQDSGNSAFKKGDYSLAVEHYSACLELDSTLVAARNNRAMALLKLQRWQDALTDCDQVLSDEPGNVKALLRKAEAHKQLGDLLTARTVFESALALEPANQEAMNGLASISS